MKRNLYFVLALATVIRILSLNQSFWLDEATTATVARDLSLSAFFQSFIPGDFHPPLYYLFIKAWGSIFGFTEISLRIPSVIFGIGTIYFVFLIAKALKDESAGFVAALLMATAPLHIYYSQEVRMYALAAFLTASLMYFYLELIKKPTTKSTLGYSISLALLALTDYLPILVLVPIWFHFRSQKKTEKLKHLFYKAHILPAVAFGLNAPTFYTQLIQGLGTRENATNWWNVLGKTNLKNTTLIPIKFLIGRISYQSRIVYALVSGGSLALYGFLVMKPIVDFKKTRILYYWLFIPVILSLLLGFFVPVVQYFRFIFVLPALYLLAALGISKLNEKYFFPALVVLLFLNLFFSWTYLSNQNFQREDWRGFANRIENDLSEKKVVFVANSQMEAYRYYSNSEPTFGPEPELNGAEKVYLMRYVQDIFDPDDKTKSFIEKNGYEKLSEDNFNGIVVWEYVKLRNEDSN